MMELILRETENRNVRLKSEIIIRDSAIDANLIEMIVKLVRGSGWDPLDLRDRLIEEFPLEEEMDPWDTGEYGEGEYEEADLLETLEEEALEFIPEPISPCASCEESCDDTACLLIEESEDK